MPVIRTYRCTSCTSEFDYWHDSPDEEAPGCFQCDGPTSYVPGRIAIKTHRSRAIDAAQTIAEQRYGLTDMKDNLREGEIAAPQMTADQRKMAEASEIMSRAADSDQALTPAQHKMVEGFWGGGGPQGAPYKLPGRGALLAQARGATAQANAGGHNPIRMLQTGVKSGAIKRGR